MEEIDEVPDASQELFDDVSVDGTPSTSAAAGGAGDCEFKTPGLSGGNLSSFNYQYRSHSKKRNIVKEKEKEIDDKIVAALEPKEKSENELFGLSIASKLSSMSPKQSALAKIQIQQLLYDIEFPIVNVAPAPQIQYSQPLLSQNTINQINQVPYSQSVMSCDDSNVHATYLQPERVLSFAQL